MREAVDSTVRTLKRNLGGQLEAIYLFGSLAQGHYIPEESDINLFVVVSEGTKMKMVRDSFSTAWHDCGNVLKRAPYVAQKEAFYRHLKLNPLLAQHLVRDSEQLFGSPDFLDDSLARIDPHEAYASLITEAMQVSTLLAPELLKEENIKSTELRMRRLARKLRNEPLPEGETAAQSFARIQHFINPIMARLPATKKWAEVVPRGGATPLLPGLRTTYNETGITILVFSKLTPQQIIQTDWGKLAKRLPHGTKGLQITTVEQLGLSIMFDRPLDLRFKKLQHAWGPDFLAAFNPTNRHIMRYSARVPSRILIEELPNIYMTQEDSEESLHEIIHDFQNKMLNVGLEHELLVRFGLIERFIPPSPVPGRETPPQQRIAALFQHLEWWTDYYASQI